MDSMDNSIFFFFSFFLIAPTDQGANLSLSLTVDIWTIICKLGEFS